MAKFTKMALDKKWIEAENRPGKAGGGFCTGLPIQKETRIFMTWGNEYAHLVLRGGAHGPNYYLHDLYRAQKYIHAKELHNPSLLVDCSHDNSG